MGTLAIASAVPFALGGGIGRAIAALFSQSEKGVWYDPSDLTSMFQDSAGTTAAVVGQPVGLVLDKSQGLALGAEKLGDLTILQPRNANSSTISEASSQFIVDSLAAGTYGLNAPTVLATAGTSAWVQCTLTSSVTRVFSVVFGAVSRNVTLTAGVPKTEIFFLTTAASTLFDLFASAAAAGERLTVDLLSLKELPGYHATQATSTARPILRQSGSLYYLEFDGVDDFLVTSAIDFSGTDKMSVFAGVRKLSDAANGVYLETSTDAGANAGAFRLSAPSANGAANYGALFRKASTDDAGAYTTYTSQITNTITTLLDGSKTTFATAISTRINAALVTGAASSNSSATVANCGNYPLYIGSRNGLSRFNGHLYSLVVRGALSDASQIAAAESYVNSKTGAY